MSNNLDFLERINDDFLTLYVEDNDQVRQQTFKMLNKLLPKIVCASDGKEGIEVYKKNIDNLNLIITDIEMPEKDGLTMIKEIRKNDKTIPIIIFSAYDNTQYFLEAINFHIDGYVLKPYPLDEIEAILNNVITRHYEIDNTIKVANSYLWNTKDYTLKDNNSFIKLTKNEIRLINFLLSNSQSIKELENIENYIFDDFNYNERRVRNIITRLNNKLDTNIIESVYAQGYKIITA